jgi:Lhr-like helicase
LDAIRAGWVVLETKIRDFTNDEEVHELVRAFEEATILPAQFHHCAHIAVALTYLAESSLDDATMRMRETLQRFTQHHGVNVYHETVTRFWMKLLDHLATTHYRDMPLWRRVNLIVERWAVTNTIAAHYSPSVISSRAARETWIAPDRLPLPF